MGFLVMSAISEYLGQKATPIILGVYTRYLILAHARTLCFKVWSAEVARPLEASTTQFQGEAALTLCPGVSNYYDYAGPSYTCW